MPRQASNEKKIRNLFYQDDNGKAQEIIINREQKKTIKYKKEKEKDEKDVILVKEVQGQLVVGGIKKKNILEVEAHRKRRKRVIG